MTGPIAAILSIMISAAAALGGVDCSQIIADAEQIEQQKLEMEAAAEYVIAIDAGHQGQGNFGQEPIGPGASQTKNKVSAGTRGTTTGVPEYQLTLDVSLKLRDALEEKGYQVVMIREDHDVNITNSERAQIANEANADVFIRVHANGSESSSANGAMTICQTPSNPYNSEYYEDSRRLSDLVLDAYTEATGIRKERVWETDTMSGINWCQVPVTIIELGYMTNPEEDVKMQDPEFQDVMVEGMVAGIEAYLDEKSATEGNTAETASIADTETAAAVEPDKAEETNPVENEQDLEEAKKAQALRDALFTTATTPACRTYRTTAAIKKIIASAADYVINRERNEMLARTGAEMDELEKSLSEEIGRMGGKWSLYLKRLDTDQVIGINENEKMVAASLIKLFVAGGFFKQAEDDILDADNYGSHPDTMISISDNGAANALINAVGMDSINEFAEANGFTSTEINRRMLENNGTENYTSARDCGVMLEQVLEGSYVNKEASDRILNALKEQERTWKIPAGIPSEVETGNKTGELGYVDNDAAIVWAPNCTYILCIMSSDAGNRISEIVHLSSMVYEAIGQAR